MQTKSRLTPKQLAVIDDLFAGDSNAQTVLEKRNIARSRFNKWLADENFKAEFIRRIEWLNLQSQAMIVHYASLAAAKLVELTESDKEETRRKACLDIISLSKTTAQKPAAQIQQEDNHQTQISPETASRLLEVLADE